MAAEEGPIGVVEGRKDPATHSLELRLAFRHVSHAEPRPGDFAAVLSDIEVAYAAAFDTSFLADLLRRSGDFEPEYWWNLPFPRRIPPEIALQVKSLSSGSFDVVMHIPWEVWAGTSTGVAVFVRNLGKIFNAPGEIRTEHARLKAERVRHEKEYYQEALQRDEAMEAYRQFKERQGPPPALELVNGELRFKRRGRLRRAIDALRGE